MTRRSSRILLTMAVAFATPAVFAAEPAKVLDGKAIFQAQQCNMCHAVSSADIKPTGKIKAPDLAGKAAAHDAALLAKYLRKQEAIGGKKHIKPFTGSDEELGALIAWLQKQNAAK
jgi:mono/diheme cytochrome c family protein